jgi:hypothetical protein
MRIILVLMTLASCILPGCQASPSARSMDQPDPYERLIQQPLPPGNVRISLERWHLDERDSQGFESFVRSRDPKLSASVGSPPLASGLNVFALRGDVSVVLGTSQTRRTTRTRSSQFVVLVPGSTAWMDVVRIDPRHGAWAVTWRGGRPIRVPSVNGSVLRVGVGRADARGVQVRLEPFLRSVAGKGGVVRIDALKTQVTLTPGVPHVIMARRDRTDSAASAWLSSRTTSGRSQVVLVMRADVGKPLSDR